MLGCEFDEGRRGGGRWRCLQSTHQPHLGCWRWKCLFENGIRFAVRLLRTDENTPGRTGIGVNLVVARTTVGDKLQALRQCIDQLLIEPSSQLLGIRFLSL